MLLVPEKPGCKILPFHLAENQLDGYIEEIRKEWVYPIDRQYPPGEPSGEANS